MKIWGKTIKLITIFVSTFASSMAWAITYAPTSVEILYQPNYSIPTGGPSAQAGALGGGIRIGYAMTSLVAFELGGYYDGYVFGGIAGKNQTAYAARATGAFAFVPSQFFRIYAGADANAFLDLPSDLATTGKKDIGIIGGVRLLVGSGAKLAIGAEYRAPLASALSYSGGTIKTSAVLGTIGIHFGGL